jgi:hypothetical protein
VSQSAVRLGSFFGRDSTEQPILLAVDTVSEIEGIGTLVGSSDSEPIVHRPPGELLPVSIRSVPRNLPLAGSKALISLWR